MCTFWVVIILYYTLKVLLKFDSDKEKKTAIPKEIILPQEKKVIPEVPEVPEVPETPPIEKESEQIQAPEIVPNQKEKQNE